ncbi:molybdopterin-binding protein [Inquilinus sp. CAU 1745]|uniref:competence/damage-inducible protein A n=1 Tax=Inquilinus sp. CAU 1745 TaxID=3140369 RepID=UPI00325C1617
MVSAALVIIGNEILSGRTKDANLSFLAGRLNTLGIQLREARVVPDVEGEIVAAVNECRAKHDYVFTTGGIGPTHDDITAAAVASALGTALELNAEARRRLEAHYDDPSKLNEARLRMAHIPVGAELVDNPISAAPGFRLENVFVFAGVPAIMQAMFESVAPTLAGGATMISRSVSAALAEGSIAAGLAAIQERYPAIDLGSYPRYSAAGYGVAIVARGPDGAQVDAAIAEVRALMRSLDAEPVEEG